MNWQMSGFHTIVLLLGVVLKLIPLLLVKLSLPFIRSQNLPLLGCEGRGTRTTG